MELELKNIAKIKHAKVEINGITVIAGENNTGKSTVGKVLWSVLNGFCQIDKKVYNEKVKELEKIISNIMEKNGYELFTSNDFLKGIFDRTEREVAIEILKSKKDNYSQKDVITLINKYKNDLKIRDLSSYVNSINRTINIEVDEIVKIIISKVLNEEFYNQINTISFQGQKKKGNISFRLQNRTMQLEIKENEISNILGIFPLTKETIYIDNPFILDSYDYEKENHQAHLANRIFGEDKGNAISKINTKRKLQKVYEKLNIVLNGEIIENNNFEFIYTENEQELNLKNLSTGLKTFAIIKMLLQNGILEENGTIILDEPEIHLHPEWQIIFAELIVLLQKEFGMHILLTTHSPYFLKAIEVYSKKYDIKEKCKYYISQNQEKEATIIDKTDKIEDIYYKLAIPFENLMNEEEIYEDR